MEFGEILNIALPIVYIVVGVALVWFVIELALTFRKTRQTVTEVQKQLKPTLDHVETITAELAPVSAKIDPLVDRASLTVDAANLEIMRVDQILEDVTQITDSVTKTMDTVDSVTSAPLDLVNSVTEKVRARFKPRAASDESVRLGSAGDAEKPNAVRDFVDAASDAASATVASQKQRRAERKAAKAAEAASAAAGEQGEKASAEAQGGYTQVGGADANAAAQSASAAPAANAADASRHDR